MVLSGSELRRALGAIKFPVDIRHHLVDAPAIDAADRGVVEDLILRGVVVGDFEGETFVRLRLTSPLTAIGYKRRQKIIPTADANQTIRRIRSKAGTIYFEFR